MSEPRDGIYMEVKQTQVGTGSTASRITFKNYYAARIAGGQADLFLLDDGLELTGLRETVSVQRLAKAYEYQPGMQDSYQALLPRLSARPQTQAAAPPPQVRPAAAPPQERPQAQPPAKAPEKKNDGAWWELTQRGAANLVKKD